MRFPLPYNTDSNNAKFQIKEKYNCFFNKSKNVLSTQEPCIHLFCVF